MNVIGLTITGKTEDDRVVRSDNDSNINEENKMDTKKLEPIAFIFQLFSGILLAVFVASHIYITHLNEEALKYESVVERLSNSTIKVIYFLFLVIVCFHAFNGLRAILLDTNFGKRNARMVNLLCLIISIVSILYGATLLISF